MKRIIVKALKRIDFELGFWMALAFLFLFRRKWYNMLMTDFAKARKEGKAYYYSRSYEERRDSTAESFDYIVKHPNF